MIYEIPDFKVDGNSVLKCIKINADLHQRLMRLKCDYVNKGKVVEMDHSISWSNVSLEFPNYVFSVRGNENIRNIYYEVSCRYSILSKVWSFSGIVGSTKFNWSKMSIMEAYTKLLETIAEYQTN